MIPVSFPLHLGYKGEKVSQLHDVLLYFIQHNLLVLTDENILDLLMQEAEKRQFGTATAAVVRQIRTENDISTPETVLVDSETATAINNILAPALDSRERYVHGFILNKDNKPLSMVQVEAFDKDYAADQQLGETTETDVNGYYKISYTVDQFETFENASADIYIKITLPGDVILQSEVYYNASLEARIDYKIEETVESGFISEYDELLAKILPLLDNESVLDELQTTDVDFFAKELFENPELIRKFILSQQFRVTTTIQSDVFYALMRQNLPNTFSQLIVSTPAVFTSALQLSVSTSIVQHYTSGEIEDFVELLTNAPAAYILSTDGAGLDESRTYRLLNVALNDTKKTGFLNYYFAHWGEADFWDNAASSVTGLSSGDVTHIKYVFTNSILTGNNPALVKHITSSGTSFNPPTNYVAKRITDWDTIIRAAKTAYAADFAIPDYIDPGANEDEQIANYAMSLKSNYDKAYPVEALKTNITDDSSSPFAEFGTGIETFIGNNPDFDLKITPAIALKKEGNTFDFTGISHEEEFIENIAVIQRLGNLTMDYAVLKEFKEANITSAKDISNMSQDGFVASYGSALGGTNNAKIVYNNAANINVITTAMVADVIAYTLNGVNAINPNAMMLTLMPDLETLFGSQDYCACTHCRSVYSPSAYLVDLLELLRKYNVNAYARLLEKRADLWNLKLSCENANVTLPYIDLVNEVLEDLMHPDFQEQNYEISARNTTLNAKQLKAFPEYLINEYPGVSGAGPYKSVLFNAVYPWRIPFNYYKEQFVEYLKVNSTNPYDVARAFTTLNPVESLNDVDSACRYLSITEREFKILTGDGSIDVDVIGGVVGVSIGDYWGVYNDPNTVGSTIDQKIPNPIQGPLEPLLISITTPLAEAATETQFNLVNIFLQQSQLSYQELLELLDCYFINPITATTPLVARKLLIENITGSDPDVDCCDINKLWIKGLDQDTDDDLGAIHRFVRLKQKIGWSFYELDRAILVAQVIDNTISGIDDKLIRIIAQMKMLTVKLSCRIDDILMMWDDIQYNRYSNYGGDNPVIIATQFAQLFRNKAVVDIDMLDYPFPTDDPFGVDFPILPSVIGLPLSGANLKIVLSSLQINASDYELLLTELGLSDDFTLANLSALYRETFLARLLKIPIVKWCVYRNWLDPFASGVHVEPFDSPLGCLEFIDKLKRIQNAGINEAQINYVFNNAFVSNDEELKVETALLLNVQGLRDKLALLKKYSAELDTDGNTLMKRLEYITDNKQANSILNILKVLPTITPSPYDFNVDDLLAFNDFINDPVMNPYVSAAEIIEKILGTPSPAAPDYAAVVPDTILDLQGRFEYFFSVVVKTILKAQTLNFIATTFKIDPSSADTLLQDLIVNGGDSAYITCMNDAFTDSTGNITTPAQSAEIEDVFDVFTKLNKVSILIDAYDLNYQDVSILSLYNEDLNINFDIANLSLIPTDTRNWYNFIDWVHLRAIFATSNKSLFSLMLPTLELAGSPTAIIKEDWFDGMMLAFGLSADDLVVLVGDRSTLTDTPTNNSNILVMDFEDTAVPSPPFAENLSQLKSQNYWKLLECIQMQATLETSVVNANEIAQAIITPGANLQEDVDIVINLLKSKYTNEDWLNVLGPVNDRLRIKRRDAMIAYILGNPCDGFKGVWRNSNDLFEQLLIDTEMMPCMLTSRTRQAIGTVQLFIDRCLLGLEEYSGSRIVLTPETGRQWNLWRKFYRIWEANRKVFLYPENWIEPDLRDNKSPFFIDLEKFLKQNEINEENIEEAYKIYLERLDEVSHLDPVAIYADEKTGVVHAWARTRSNPHLYFHRIKAENEWSPWVKMDMQIDGDHFVPVMWRGRMRFYWLIFTEQVMDTKPQKLMLDEEMPAPFKYWKIELAWSEYKSKRWQPKQIGKEFLVSTDLSTSRQIDLDWNYIHMNDAGYDKSWHPLVPLNTPDTIKVNMQLIKDHMTLYATKNAMTGDIEIVLTESIICVTPAMVFALTPLPNNVAPTLQQAADLFNTNMASNSPNTFRQHLGKFTIKYNGVFTDKMAWLEYFNYYHEYLSASTAWLGYDDMQSKYMYNLAAPLGYTHDPDENYWKLLNKAPGYTPREQKYIVLQRQVPYNQTVQSAKINFHKFMYRDYRNSYYVERTNDPVKYSVFSLGTGFPGANINVNTGILGANAGIANGPGTLSGAGLSLSNDPWLNTGPNNQYRFFPFYHYTVNEMSQKLFENGITGLFDFSFVESESENIYQNNTTGEVIDFITEYDPTIYVDERYPKSYIDYSFDGPFSLYNWELFFHIPMLIAGRLMQNQKFFEARQWYHYVFDPTSMRNGDIERFWNFIPFNHHAQQGIPTILQIMNGTLSADTIKAIAKWEQNPFQPHLVARTRTGAYMRNIVMKYLDNLIAWGDQLFRRDTMETINEATLMYILAAEILGRRPFKIPPRLATSAKTYTELQAAGLNAFANAQVAVESILAPTAVTLGISNVNMDYFCIPPNEKLLSYWDVIGDRLFKIRHCQNIDGVERALALFDPPIDPALLVKAASMGISATDAANAIASPLPQYRFSIMVQKAAELTQEVKSMGGALLAALEKRDSEQISLLRSSQEITMLNRVKEIRELQSEEAKQQIVILNEQKKMVAFRKDYYQNLIENGLNQHEQSQLDSLKLSIPLKINQSIVSELAGVMHLIPNLKAGSPPSLGFTFGGDNLGSLTERTAGMLGVLASLNDIKGSMAGIKGSYARRSEEWTLQNKLADRELKQMEIQILAAEIRYAISKKELSNHEVQMKHTLEMDELMHSKFTNEDLYNWMLGEISLTYFQAYNLAIDVAKQAERCYNYELGTQPAVNFINFGYWDSLKKGLLAGDNLLLDIKRMDVAYLEQHKRQHELTKHISLASFDAQALMKFRNGEKVFLDIPEWLFDMDYPGHFFRRIKSVSISIPCIAGPYTSVSCKLTLNSSKYRKSAIVVNSYIDDENYNTVYSGGLSIATSNAQNDSGMFELNFRDERYLPFEGAGVISSWTLELPSAYAQFDLQTITDVIFHIKYTARYDGGLATEAEGYVTDIVEQTVASEKYLPRIFSLRTEFANEWNKYVNDVNANPSSAKLSIKLNHEMYPYFTIGKDIMMPNAVFEVAMNDGFELLSGLQIKAATYIPTFVGLTNNFAAIPLTSATLDEAMDAEITFEFEIDNGGAIEIDDLNQIRDIYFAVIYNI